MTRWDNCEVWIGDQPMGLANVVWSPEPAVAVKPLQFRPIEFTADFTLDVDGWREFQLLLEDTAPNAGLARLQRANGVARYRRHVNRGCGPAGRRTSKMSRKLLRALDAAIDALLPTLVVSDSAAQGQRGDE